MYKEYNLLLIFLKRNKLKDSENNNHCKKLGAKDAKLKIQNIKCIEHP